MPCLKGYPSEFYNHLSKEISTEKMLENSYLFEISGKYEHAYILHEGLVKRENDGKMFRKGDFITKDILEANSVNEGTRGSYSVLRASMVLKISTKFYQKFVNDFIK